MDIFYFAAIGLCTIIALSNWRTGIFACVLLDAVRDPIRKLDEQHSFVITLAATLVWGGVFMGMYQQRRRETTSLPHRYPNLRRAIICLTIAILPAGLLTCLLYPSGWVVAAIGAASYIIPLLGIAAGFVFAAPEGWVVRLLSFYCLVNGVMLIGTPLEYSGRDWQVLGGIDMEWVRYHEDYVVNLISGFYRSPDIMGLHAAHVAMFSLILATRSGKLRGGWIAVTVWAAICILLCGRRKMIAIPLAFVAIYLLIGLVQGVRRSNLLIRATAVMALTGAMILFLVREREVSYEYLQYATTLFTQGAERTNQLIVDSVLSTLYQSGVLGSGLGSATQGNYYVGGPLRGSWQEDGVSRLFKELGVHGAILVMISLYFIIRVVIRALRSVPHNHYLKELQLGMISVVLANGISFLASHQQYSGDPMTALLVALCLGIVLGLPRIVMAERYAFWRKTAALATEVPADPVVRPRVVGL